MDRFAAALSQVRDAELAAPELLGVCWAKASTLLLPIAAAGLSVFGGDGVRAPVGASDADATRAERLQFTLGEGPCLAAHATARTVVAPVGELAACWPGFYGQLVASTPYRCVASTPLGGALAGIGTIDLYFRTTSPQDFDLGEAEVVADHIGRSLSAQPWARFVTGLSAPAWLYSPTNQARSAVTIAMGMLTVIADLTFTDALAVLRAHAFAIGSSVDEVAAAIVSRTLPISDLDVTGNR